MEDTTMQLRNAPKLLLATVFVVAALAAGSDAGKPITVKGYVLDSACAFTKGLEKPISKECATACAKAGSPLVILTDDDTIYWPIADTTPSSGQNEKLLLFAGQKVAASGKVFQRGGSSALVIEKIEPFIRSEVNSRLAFPSGCVGKGHRPGVFGTNSVLDKSRPKGRRLSLENGRSVGT